MRAIYFLIVGVCLALISCGSKGDNAPPPLDKGMLLGKWEAREADQLIQAIEFKDDKTFVMRFLNVPDAISGTYSWSGEFSLGLQYQPSEAAQAASKGVLKDIKSRLADGAAKMGGGPIGDNMRKTAEQYPDEWPAKNEMRVSLSDRYGPDLTLVEQKGLIFSFKKPK
jgi:hypothetical protein